MAHPRMSGGPVGPPGPRGMRMIVIGHGARCIPFIITIKKQKSGESDLAPCAQNSTEGYATYVHSLLYYSTDVRFTYIFIF